MDVLTTLSTAISQVDNLKIGIVITATIAGKSDNLHGLENRYQQGNGIFVLSGDREQGIGKKI